MNFESPNSESSKKYNTLFKSFRISFSSTQLNFLLSQQIVSEYNLEAARDYFQLNFDRHNRPPL